MPRVWGSLPNISTEVRGNGESRLYSNRVPIRTAVSDRGIPHLFSITIAVPVVQSMFWLVLLITIVGLKSYAWCLLVVGCIGVFENALLAAKQPRPRKMKPPSSTHY